MSTLPERRCVELVFSFGSIPARLLARTLVIFLSVIFVTASDFVRFSLLLLFLGLLRRRWVSRRRRMLRIFVVRTHVDLPKMMRSWCPITRCDARLDLRMHLFERKHCSVTNTREMVVATDRETIHVRTAKALRTRGMRSTQCAGLHGKRGYTVPVTGHQRFFRRQPGAADTCDVFASQELRCSLQ